MDARWARKEQSMKRKANVSAGLVRLVALIAATEGAALMAVSCTGDDTTYSATDGGHDATTSDVQVPDEDSGSVPTVDAGLSRPPWLLLTLNYAAESEMVAYSVPAKAVDSRLTYDGQLGTTYVDDSRLWLLEQQKDVVVKLDPKAPWKGGPSWNVRLDDRVDGGKTNADPIAVVAGPAGKAYVLRFNRNRIAVVDTNVTTADAAAPTKVIDFTSLLGPGDRDGNVDVVGAVYFAARQRLYVLLGNMDLKNVALDGYTFLCGATKPLLVAVDTNTDTVVPALDGGAPASPIALDGYNPVFNGMLYDAPRDRMLVFHAGCNLPGAPDAGPGPVDRRRIEAVNLNTGAVSTVVDLNALGYPAARAKIDDGHFVLGFFGVNFGPSQTFYWDVTSSTLGAEIKGAPDMYSYDGKGALIGTRTDYLADGGFAASVVSLKLDAGDAGATTLGPVPYSKPSDFSPGAVDYWSPPQ
jgi:hypothetical protein